MVRWLGQVSIPSRRFIPAPPNQSQVIRLGGTEDGGREGEEASLVLWLTQLQVQLGRPPWHAPCHT